jgi:endonuclease YncB( thermonuclease family)
LEKDRRIRFPIAIVAGCVAFWLAHWRAGTSPEFAVVYGGVVFVGIVLAAGPTPRDKLTDAGRGLVVTVILALVASSISHSDARRSARTSLALTLSSGQDFTGIDLNKRDLSEFFIGGKVLDEAHLEDANLHEAVLRHTSLVHADLHGSKTNLKKADLSFTNLRRADLRQAHLEDSNLTEADLRDAQLAGAHLRGAILDGADARGADFRDADLQGAQLLGTDLRGAFFEADVPGAVFSGDLRDANLDGAAIKRLRMDGKTVWRPGFDLQQEISKSSAPPRKPVPIRKGATADAVVDVADGDTIALRGQSKVRLLGINAPRGERPRECYALGATADLKRLLPRGTAVLYKLGVTRHDKFGRALAYVWTQDGRFVNEAIVERGDAIFKSPPKTTNKKTKKLEELPLVEKFYVERLRRAQIRAEMAQHGLWRACTELPSAESGR